MQALHEVHNHDAVFQYAASPDQVNEVSWTRRQLLHSQASEGVLKSHPRCVLESAPWHD